MMPKVGIVQSCLEEADWIEEVFGNRIADKWNALSNSCMDCTTLNEFKSKTNLELEPKT